MPPLRYRWVCLRNFTHPANRTLSSTARKHEQLDSKITSSLHTDDGLDVLNETSIDDDSPTASDLRRLAEEQDSKALGDLKRCLQRVDRLITASEHSLLAINAANQKVQVNPNIPAYTILSRDSATNVREVTSRMRYINKRVLENVYDFEILPYPHEAHGKSPSARYADKLKEVADGPDGEEKLQKERDRIEYEYTSQNKKFDSILVRLRETRQEVERIVMGKDVQRMPEGNMARPAFATTTTTAPSSETMEDLSKKLTPGTTTTPTPPAASTESTSSPASTPVTTPTSASPPDLSQHVGLPITSDDLDAEEPDSIGAAKIEAEADSINLSTPTSSSSSSPETETIGTAKIEAEAEAASNNSNSDIAARIAAEVGRSTSSSSMNTMEALKAKLAAGKGAPELEEEDEALEGVLAPMHKERIEQVDPEEEGAKRSNPFGR